MLTLSKRLAAAGISAPVILGQIISQAYAAEADRGAPAGFEQTLEFIQEKIAREQDEIAKRASAEKARRDELARAMRKVLPEVRRKIREGTGQRERFVGLEASGNPEYPHVATYRVSLNAVGEAKLMYADLNAELTGLYQQRWNINPNGFSPGRLGRIDSQIDEILVQQMALKKILLEADAADLAPKEGRDYWILRLAVGNRF